MLSAVTALALSGVATPIASCSWDHPGAHPFMGDVPAAVQHYTDIPRVVRRRLQARMARRDSDDFVAITRDGIAGRHDYGPDISGMHFGAAGRVCAEISRARWKPADVERGLVYCDSGYCILVPTVCRNVSRITRRPDAEPLDISPAAGPLMADEAPEALFAPPAEPVLALPGEASVLPDTAAPYNGGPFYPLWPPLLPVVGGGGGGLAVVPPPVIASVPEPSAWLLLASAAGLLWLVRFSRRP
jgi:hypothetical protein